MLGDEDVSCDVEDECVELAGIKRQRVVIVEAVDLDVSQAHLVVGKNGVRVNTAGGHNWDHKQEDRTTPKVQVGLVSFIKKAIYITLD